MNKSELKAMLSIAKKLDWNSRPVVEVTETISQMVWNKQSLELDTVGECDDFEDTLLSMSLWDKEVVLSTLFVSDCQTLFICEDFCGDMGITLSYLCVMIEYYGRVLSEAIADEMDYEEMMKQNYLDTIYSCMY